MNQTNLKAVTVTATGTALATQRVKVKGVYFVPTVAGVAPSIQLRDGGAGGTTLLDLLGSAALAATDPVPTQLMFPENGILFQTDVHATLTSVASLTLIYG